jgi:F-type H+-transporting ATPase subunit b
MPQFEFATWPGQIFWLLVTFAVLYGVLSRVFIPRVRHAIDTRRDQIANDMAEARRLRDEAEAQAEIADAQMAEGRLRAQHLAADAKAKSAAESANRQAALETELSGKLEEAETRIRASRDQAMSQVRGIAADTGSAITEKLSGKAVVAGELDRALIDVSAPVGAQT